MLRHSRALKRTACEGADPERPLTDIGRQQAQRIIPVLSAYGVTRVVSSDATRCLETVAPYARDHVLAIETDPGVSEEGATPDSVAAGILDALGVADEPLAPGEMIVCHHRKGRVVAVERHSVV